MTRDWRTSVHHLCGILFAATFLTCGALSAKAQVASPPDATTAAAPVRRPLIPGNASSPTLGGAALLQQLRHQDANLDPVDAIRRYGVHPHDAGSTPPIQTQAPFLGNLTTVVAPADDAVALRRMPGAPAAPCSLTNFTLSYAVSPSTSSYSNGTSTPNYEQTLHSEAGLTTKGDLFANGCKDPNLGTASRDAAYVGQTTNGLYVGATAQYNSAVGNNQLYTMVSGSSGQLQGYTAQPIDMYPTAVAAADLNSDGNGDIVAAGANSSEQAILTVLLGNADGSFQAGVDYAIPGDQLLSLTIDDVNGDGKLDIVAASESTASYPATFQYSVLLGNGDGSFQQPKSYTLTGSSTLGQIITATLTGSGHKDIVSSTGTVLLGNGDGTFTPAPQASFPYATDLASADFNNDGKTDIVVSTSSSFSIFYGNGDGTFQTGPSYANVGNEGLVIASDLDGDGNIDLFSGLGNAGFFGGDEFSPNEAYAVMGTGNGQFSGAPDLPVRNTGSNVADVNGDGNLDIVGLLQPDLNAPPYFISYLGDGRAGFTAGPQLNLTSTGTNPIGSVNSYVVADFNGDKKPDLLMIPEPYPGGGGFELLYAPGNGDGSFGTPVAISLPSFVAKGDTDENPYIGGLFAADFNHDGKLDIIYTLADQSGNTGNYLEGYAVQLGNGDGTFQPPVISYTYNSPQLLNLSTSISVLAAIADLNHDGNPDLVVIAVSPQQTGVVELTKAQVMLGNGDGSFGAAATVSSADNPTAYLAVADLNNDGKLDLVTLGANATNDAGELAVSLGNGDGTFQNATIYPVTGTSDAAVAVADFNGDGKPDVAVNGMLFPESGIYLGNGDGTLQTISEPEGNVAPGEGIAFLIGGSSSVYDFNNDGQPDIFVSNVLLIHTAQSSSTPPLAASSVALTASATSITQGQSLTLTATVTGPSGNTTVPTGTVTFLDGTTTLGTATLNASGVATFNTSSLAVGTHSITASYGGDQNFASATSSAVSITVQQLPQPSFTLALSPTTGTISAPGSTTTTVTVTPANGFNQAVSFACSGLPTGTTCSFSPATVTPSGAAASTTLTVQATSASGQIRHAIASTSAFAMLLFGVFGLTGARRTRHIRHRMRLLSILVLACAAAIALGCGGSHNNSPTPTTSSITVTATSGQLTQSAVFTLTVQ